MHRSLVHTWRQALLLTALTLLAALAANLVPAQDSSEAESKLQVHGFLSQAYATTHQHQLLGIPEDGTVDYRNAALQFRYAMSPKDTFVIQLAHDRLGKSPLMAVTEEVSLDWAFYEHAFSDSLSVKVGRVQLPQGIYNEIRDVGTILPFYRPPSDLYWEGSYATEAFDGALVSKTFGAGKAWSLVADAYYGGWDLNALDSGQILSGNIEDAYGIQLWLTTPVEGLRVGWGGTRARMTGAAPLPAGRVSRWQASLDGDFAKLRVSTEYQQTQYALGTSAGYYGFLGYRVLPKLGVNLQASRTHEDLTVGPYSVDADASRDYALGLSYAFRPDLVVKAEHHWADSRALEDIPSGAFLPSVKVRYAILSLAASF